LEDLFEEFLAFFFPHIHREVDFAKGYQFLDKELQQIIKSSNTGRRIVDKLIKVYLLDGSETWLLIHIEIQGYEQEEFPERMYIYNYRLFDKFRREIISLALLTDDNLQFRPNEYRRSRWGFELLCRYPIIKIIDYRDHLPELETSSQPFALIVRAYLQTLKIAGNVQERYSWKKRFLLELYERGMKRETVLAIYKFIDWIMTLPEELDAKLSEEIKNIEETKTMSYITTAERIGLKKGLEQGMAQGVAQGMAQGIASIVDIKFGEAGQNLSARAFHIQNVEMLQKLMKALKQAQSLGEAERMFDEIENSGAASRAS